LDTPGSVRAFEFGYGGELSGVLSDGTPFILAKADGDSVRDGTLTLHATSLPAIGPPIINVPADTAPLGVRQGQTLNVSDGAILRDNFNSAWGSTVNIIGGSIGRNFEALGTSVTMTGGSVGDDFDAFQSSVAISGGTIGDMFQAHEGSTVTISGGTVGEYSSARIGSAVNISGGSIGKEFRADHFSIVNISGGNVGVRFRARQGSTVNISGGLVGRSFNAIAGSTVNISGGVFAGDFATSGNGIFDFIPATEINISGGALGDYFHDNHGIVNISGGSIGDDFQARGSEVNFSGGTIGNDFDASDASTIHISGGSIGDKFDVRESTVNISGGVVGDDCRAWRFSMVNISGGTVGSNFTAFEASTVNIAGGSIRSGFWASYGSMVNISGGTIGESFGAYEQSTVNILGTEFLLDGVPIDGLNAVGDSLVLEDRGSSVLGVTLRDGRHRDFVLKEEIVAGVDFFDEDATLRLTLSSPWLFGDINRDGTVDRTDATGFVRHIGSTDGTWSTGDFDNDGVTGLKDLALLQTNLGSTEPPAANQAEVPEPCGFVLLLGGVICLATACRAHAIRERRVHASTATTRHPEARKATAALPGSMAIVSSRSRSGRRRQRDNMRMCALPGIIVAPTRSAPVGPYDPQCRQRTCRWQSRAWHPAGDLSFGTGRRKSGLSSAARDRDC
jgi:hypothetical protein